MDTRADWMSSMYLKQSSNSFEVLRVRLIASVVSLTTRFSFILPSAAIGA